MKRFFLFLLVFCMVLSCCAFGWKTDDSWSDDYWEFIDAEGYRTQRGTDAYWDTPGNPLYFSLYDLDSDGIPELLIRDHGRAMASSPWDVFGWTAEGIRYIGGLGSREGVLHFTPGSVPQGLFCYDGNMGAFTCRYFMLQDGKITFENVMSAAESTNGEYKQTSLTQDPQLLKEFYTAYPEGFAGKNEASLLPSLAKAEINSIGWDNFVAGMEAATTFYDVGVKDYYAPPVAWAAGNNVTQGVSSTRFSPNQVCTRAQMVTFLWRAMGSPEPAAKTNPFMDVKESDYYYAPVLWASETGVTAGTDTTHFSPNDTVSRAQAVTFLWRVANKIQPQKANPFVDVPQTYYTDAVRWASESGVTAGTDANHFSPGDGCTRAQIVTFLYRYMQTRPNTVVLPGVKARHLAAGEEPKGDQVALIDETASSILFTFTEDVQNVKLLEVDVSSGKAVVTDKALFEYNAFRAEYTLLVQVDLPDVGPRYALQFTLDGKTCTYGITDSGKDGSLILMDMNA